MTSYNKSKNRQFLNKNSFRLNKKGGVNSSSSIILTERPEASKFKDRDDIDVVQINSNDPNFLINARGLFANSSIQKVIGLQNKKLPAYMFLNCKNLSQNKDDWDLSNCDLRKAGGLFQESNINSVNGLQGILASEMFNLCKNLSQNKDDWDLSKCDLSQATGLFAESNINSVNGLQGILAPEMFDRCKNLTILDLSNCNLTKAEFLFHNAEISDRIILPQQTIENKFPDTLFEECRFIPSLRNSENIKNIVDEVNTYCNTPSMEENPTCKTTCEKLLKEYNNYLRERILTNPYQIVTQDPVNPSNIAPEPELYDLDDIPQLNNGVSPLTRKVINGKIEKVKEKKTLYRLVDQIQNERNKQKISDLCQNIDTKEWNYEYCYPSGPPPSGPPPSGPPPSGPDFSGPDFSESGGKRKFQKIKNKSKKIIESKKSIKKEIPKIKYMVKSKTKK